MGPVLSVVVPTRNRRETLRRTIEGWVRHQGRASFELLVVDDGSEDGTAEYLTAEAVRDPRVRAFRQDHAGPAQARNRAIAEALGRYLLFTGDDIRPGEGLADAHVAAHEASTSPAIVLGRTEWDRERPITPVMRHITGFGGQQFRYDYLRDGQRLGFKYFYGSNISVPRASLSALPGPFDAAFGGAALEDADLGYRLMGARREITYRAGLLAWHDHPYDLAGFAMRQYRVGRSTAPLAAKHPEIAREFGWHGVSEAIEAAAAARTAGVSGISRDDVTEMEGQILTALAAVEHLEHRELDRIYLGLFWYFQAKGMAETRVRAEELSSVLVHLMQGAINCPVRSALRRSRLPWPAPARATLEKIVSQLDVPSGGSRSSNCLRWRLSVRARELRYAFRAG